MSPRTITASSMTEITSVIIRTWLLGMFFIFPPGIRGSQLACTRKCIKNPSACRTAHMRITAFKSTLKDEPAPHCHRSVWQEASEGGGYGGCNGGGGGGSTDTQVYRNMTVAARCWNESWSSRSETPACWNLTQLFTVSPLERLTAGLENMKFGGKHTKTRQHWKHLHWFWFIFCSNMTFLCWSFFYYFFLKGNWSECFYNYHCGK